MSGARFWHPWLRINRVLRVMQNVSNIGDVDLEITAEQLLGEVCLRRGIADTCPRGYRHFKEGAVTLTGSASEIGGLLHA